MFFIKIIGFVIKSRFGISGQSKVLYTHNYPTFYGKDIYTQTGTSVVAEFNAMIDRDDKLRAYLMAKKEPMMFNITRFETYLLYRDSLIAVLKSSLDE